MIPDQYRLYTESLGDAGQVHQISEELLEQLLDLGLPCRADPSGYRFDRKDLENVGLALRLPSPRYLAMQWWSRSLEVDVPAQRRKFSLRMSPKCPNPGHSGPCTFAVSSHVAAAAVPGSLVTTRAGKSTVQAVDVSIDNRAMTFDGVYSDLFDRLDALTFHIIPAAMPTETAFARETGLADCQIAARLLVEEAAEVGLRARPASGFFMAYPFPMRHVWVEFWLSDSWWPADPFLLRWLDKWGIVDGERWPVYRSPAGLLWRLDTTELILVPVIYHGAKAVDCSLVMRKNPPGT
jgi:hypothetical protein